MTPGLELSLISSVSRSAPDVECLLKKKPVVARRLGGESSCALEMTLILSTGVPFVVHTFVTPSANLRVWSSFCSTRTSLGVRK